MKKGFTLIELLAVIVILAIILLIAIPIIANIVEDAQDESNKRSIEMYASAIKNGIATYQLNKGIMPSNIQELKQENFIEYDGAEVICKTEKIYEDGSIYLDKCNIDGNLVNYTYGSEKLEFCTLLEDIDPKGISYGDKYSCDPGDGIKRNFYVLEDGNATLLTKGDTGTTGFNEISLIMDSNLEVPLGCSDDCNFNLVLTSVLNSVTNDWINVTVNLPTMYQIANAAGYSGWVNSDGNTNNHVNLTSASWLYENISSYSDSYWTTTQTTLGGIYWDVSVGEASGTGIIMSYKLRPVITVSKE